MGEREHTLTKDCWCNPTVETVEGHTNYEAIVPQAVRDHTAALMASWVADGRPDTTIDNLVRSLVLAAYAHGQDDVVAASGLVCVDEPDWSRIPQTLEAGFRLGVAAERSRASDA